MSDTSTKLTFSQYLASKETLLSAVKSTPQQVVEYRVHKYCKLTVGATKTERDHVNLKPDNTILVDWLYEDADNPTPVSLRFEGSPEVEDESHSASWSGERLLNWLTKNTNEV